MAGGILNSVSTQEVASRIRETTSCAGGPSRTIPDGSRILVVDDNAVMRDFFQRLLTPHYEVITVCDGQAALEAAHLFTPDLILTDIAMPGFDGIELVRRLRADAKTQTLPIILLSARTDEDLRILGLQAGADDYMVHPIGARELLARVNGALTLAQVRRNALRREEELRAEVVNVIESMTDSFVSVDAQWRIITINAAAERSSGLPREKILGRDCWDLLPGLRGMACESKLRFAMTHRTSVKFECHYAPSDRWFDVHAFPVQNGGLASYARDITARKKAEWALRLREEEFRAIFESNGVGMVQSHPRNGRVLRVNGTLLRMTGYPELELLGATLPDLIHPEDRPRLLDGFSKLNREETSSFEAECRFLRSDKTYLWIVLTGSLVKDSAGRPIRTVSVLKDISRRKQTMEALAHSRSELEAALEEMKLAREQAEAASRTKDHFLAVLSHELRTPLTPALLAAQSLLRREDLPARVMESLRMIQRNIATEAHLIDDLLDLTRIARGKLEFLREPLDLHDVIRRALEVTEPDFRAKKQMLAVELCAPWSEVNGDPHRLQQVFWNLLKNASKFTPAGGEIRVLSRRESDSIVVRVSDSGRGIEPEALPFIFEPFNQANQAITREFGGLGLGLAISKATVDALGGRIVACSEGEGRGATFVVQLPVAGIPGFQWKKL